jgi:Zn-dependent peptidase ImmA (M78 family)/DNA-binding XRE family transcriptional regulator
MVDNIRMKGQLLELARESRGLNQSELANRMNISQAQLSKYERGEKAIPESRIQKFAKELDYNKAFFSHQGSIENIHLDFRKATSLKSTHVKSLKAIINRTKIELNELIQNFETQTIEIPQGEFGTRPEDIAKEVRKIWGLSSGPINNLFQTVEQNGIALFPLNLSSVEYLESDKFSACALSIGEKMPLIIYNKMHSMDRNRFSVAHEIGHIFCHHFGTFYEHATEEGFGFDESEKLREKEANLFASEFLMPEVDIKEDLEELHAYTLGELKKKWKVSMAALVERARALGTITYENYIQLRKYLSYKGWLLEEPFPLESETPSFISNLIKTYINNFGVTVNALAKRLGLKLDEFTRIYPVKLEVQAM